MMEEIWMNNIATTTSIIDSKSVESRDLQVESFDVNFNEDSSNIIYEGYSVTTVENYPEFIESFKKTLNWTELLNEKQIMDFVFHNIGLLELIQNVESIVKEHFPENSFGLEFDEDPEISSLSKLVLYVKSDESSFDEDWEEVKKANRDIKKLSLYDDSAKRLFSVDLW